MQLKSKMFASAVALSMVLSMVAVPASAQTTAELTAQINALLAQIAQLQAQIGGSSVAVSATFTKDLTIGSTGSEVTALQQFLVSKGHLTMPAGVAYGYFGAMTKAALAKYQAAAGITPASGYFGPLTRAKVNALGGTTTTTGGTTTTSTGGITTPGAEGTLTVSANNAGLISTVYEGDAKAAIYGFNVEAKNSDIAIQRVKIDLGASSKIYTKGYSRMYVTIDGNVLASTDLNSSTVVKEGSEYYVTVTGFNYVVAKGAKKQVVLKADVMSSIDSADMDGSGTDDLDNITITIPASGVRGVDGAGIDQYGPSTALAARGVSFSTTLAESATLKMSLNSASPKKAQVVATAGTNENEYSKLPLMVFDLKAEKDAVTVTDLNIEVAKTGSGAATATTVYLYDGSTELDNATIVGNRAVFSDIDLVVAKDTTRTLTVKADIGAANGTVATFTAGASTTGVAINTENSQGDSVTESGSATGYGISVVNVGAEVSLLSKNVVTSGVPQGSGSNAAATSTLTATFNVKIKAVGGDLLLGSIASDTPVFAKTGATNSFKVYANGTASDVTGLSTSTSYTIPSSCTADATNSCTLAEGNSVEFPVTYQISGRSEVTGAITSGLYAVALEKVNWVANYTTSAATFMAGEQDWRTNDVSFP